MGHDLATTWSRSRTEVDDVVGGTNRFFVVFDHDNGIAEIAQLAQRPQKPRVIALVQSDAWFIEHVKNTSQAGPDLACQPDALGLAAGKRAALSVER